MSQGNNIEELRDFLEKSVVNDTTINSGLVLFSVFNKNWFTLADCSRVFTKFTVDEIDTSLTLLKLRKLLIVDITKKGKRRFRISRSKLREVVNGLEK